MLLVFVRSITPRLRYTFDFIFRDILGMEYSFTQDADQFSFHTGPRMSYTDRPVGDEPFFFATSLLFEKGVHQQEISVFDWESGKVFFATHPKFLLPFDPFAATFYLVSRYEEYLPHKRDQHDRFDARESLAYQKGFLHLPVVDQWAYRIRDLLLHHFPGLTFQRRSYQYISTVDIDNAWAYREKGFVRTVGALGKALFRFDFSSMVDRCAVLLGSRKDPYDTYELLNILQQRYRYPSIYFVLLGDYGEYDRNVSPYRRAFQSLIKSLVDYNRCGIHPSYRSGGDAERVRLEKGRLRKMIRRDVTDSRQHFLRIRFPDTYRNLIDCDITDDYSMGYANETGFRAGTCTPFYFYDLEQEHPTHLRIHPFAVMDATLRFYQRVRPEEAMGTVGPLIKAVKAVDGNFVSLWHNESLSEREPWVGWRTVYEELVKSASA